MNRVATSGLITIDLMDFYHPGERTVFDIADLLYERLVLKERDFRAFAKDHDWSRYKDMNVALDCTADAIVPTWAYMLLTTKLAPYANMVVRGNLETLETLLYYKAISGLNPLQYSGARVVIKGCSKVAVPESAYILITEMLLPHVASLMYGEPCSTVPLYKAPREKG